MGSAHATAIMTPMATARRAHAVRLTDDLVQDVRYAARQTRRAPLSTALVVVTLAVGIGATVTIAGAIDRLLFRAPSGIRQPDRVVRVLSRSSGAGGDVVGSRWHYPFFLELRRSAPALSTVAAYTTRELSLGIGPEAVPVRAALVSSGYFAALGVVPAVGRLFGDGDGFPGDASTGGRPVAVLAYGFWQRQFAASPSALGTTLRIDGVTYTVVGVAPRAFQGVGIAQPDLWLPLTVAATGERAGIDLADAGSAWLAVVGRLAPNSTRSTVERQATAIAARFAAAQGLAGANTVSVVAAPLARGRGPDGPREARVTIWLGGVAFFVLLIACANVANLLLGRALARRREIAVRLALGATPSRLSRQLAAEALVLTGLGGAAAFVLASVFGAMLARALFTGSAAGGFVDLRLAVFTVATTLGTAALVSLGPVAQGYETELSRTLRMAGGHGAGRGRGVARWGLVAVQSALCMVLLVGAGLFALSLGHVNALDLGMDADHTLVARFDLNGLLLAVPEVDATLQEIRDRVSALPGVRRVAFAERDPNRAGRAVAIHTLAHDADSYWHRGPTAPVPMESAVDSGFFRTVGASSLRGRDFSSEDVRGAPRVAILNAPLAALLFPNEDALGKCVILPVRANDRDDGCVRVVGVLGGFWQHSILERDRLAVYVPLTQRTVRDGIGRPRALYVATTGDPTAVESAVRAAIQGVRADLPAVTVTTMAEIIEPEVRPWRLAAALFVGFGGVALVIAVVGLYGVVNAASQQRSVEMAIRIALGARRRDVLLEVGGKGLTAVLVGLVVGIAAALALRGWLAPLLFQVAPDDPRVIGALGFLLLGVGLVAALAPAVRVLRRSPATVLQAE